MRHFSFRYLSRSSQISLSFVSDISHVRFRYLSVFVPDIQKNSSSVYYINKVYSIILALLYPFGEAILQKNHFFLRKVWWLLFFVIPLHSLLRQAVYLLVVNKASFFEKIYIDREVVQEASVAINYSIRWVKETSQLIYYRCINLILLDNQF